jgi:hypothetical protein
MTADTIAPRRSHKDALRVATLNDTHPSLCPIVQQVRRDYARWYYDLSEGYILYYLPDFGQEYAHEVGAKRQQRLVAERAFGPIPPGHIVRRRNQDRTDNRAANLYLASRADHALTTFSHQPAETYTCPTCGTAFKAPHHRIERSHSGQLFCSRTCKQLAERKVTRPTADELRHLMREIGNWSALGRHFGVSDNAVRKWARHYGVDLALCGSTRKSKPATAPAPQP